MSFLLTYLTLFALVQKFAVHLFSISFKLVLPVTVIARSAFSGKQPGLQIRHSCEFTIKSRGLSSCLAMYENLYLEPYDIDPAFNYTTLFPNMEEIPSMVGVLNGTPTGLRNGQGSLLFLGAGGWYSFRY